MSRHLKLWILALAAVPLALVGACGDDTTATPTDTGTDTGADTGGDMVEDTGGDFVTVSFSVDDTANQVYVNPEENDDGDLVGLGWKGSFNYDLETNILSFDASWAGPYMLLWDDGPVSGGGHEAEGEEADDHIFGVAVLVEVTAEEQNFEYGAMQNYVQGAGDGGFDDQWIWIGDNGTFTVPANATEDVEAPGLVLPAHGTIDVRFTLDGSALADGFLAEGVDVPSESDGCDGVDVCVTVKSGAWGWIELATSDDGTNDDDETANDDIYRMVLSEHVGDGTELRFGGLMGPGTVAPFVFVIGGNEYKVGGVPPADGVTVEYDAGDGFTELTVDNEAEGDMNTFVTIPDDTM